jgi:GAF domain-containing protein
MDEWSADDFSRMAQELYDQPGLDETVEQVTKYACPAVGCDFADVALVHRRKQIETVASTDPLAEKAVQRQLELGVGPVLDLVSSEHGVVAIRDMGSETRWTRWCSDVGALGIRSLISVRLSTGTSVMGTLNLYGRQAGQFDDDDVAVAHILARHASVAVAAAKQEATLWQAIDARKAVGQAQGILMERFDLTADQAFAILRRYSQDHNIKLNKVARDLIATRQLPGPRQPVRETASPTPEPS